MEKSCQWHENDKNFQREIRDKIKRNLPKMKEEIKIFISDILDIPGAERTIYFLHDILKNLYHPEAMKTQKRGDLFQSNENVPEGKAIPGTNLTICNGGNEKR